MWRLSSISSISRASRALRYSALSFGWRERFFWAIAAAGWKVEPIILSLPRQNPLNWPLALGFRLEVVNRVFYWGAIDRFRGAATRQKYPQYLMSSALPGNGQLVPATDIANAAWHSAKLM